MIASEDLIRENEAIYLPPFYHSERGTAKKLLTLINSQGANNFGLKADIKAIEKVSGIEYDEVQIAAIQQAIRSKVWVLYYCVMETGKSIRDTDVNSYARRGKK